MKGKKILMRVRSDLRAQTHKPLSVRFSVSVSVSVPDWGMSGNGFQVHLQGKGKVIVEGTKHQADEKLRRRRVENVKEMVRK